MAARDDSRRDAEYDDIAHDDIAHDDIARGDGEHDDLALGDGTERVGPERVGPAQDGARQHDDGARRHDDVGHDGSVYAGMDALMAALLDEPLPEEALRDAEFVASRDAAAADIALLREQLGLIGEALAVTGEDAVAGVPPGRPVAARPGDAAGAETDSGRVSGPAQAPTTSVTPLLPRPYRARRALKITFGTLAAAAAASVVLGVGWVVVQSGAGVNSSKSADSAASDESAKGGNSLEDGDRGDGSASLSPEGYVGCARLIVEGTVTEVEPVTGAQQDRITVEVDRWIKPDKGDDRIVFPMDHDVDPRLKQGDHVLVGIPHDSAQPDIWTTKEADIARDRAWIEEALSGTGGSACE
ncbi:hypothetical protein [Streptomyces europaeiscabiei]|uniref:hypothetical protein n=1 Tax=Streptomyces europaeiscabiei TaxID=146819 RepID=UPI0029BD27FF|nr:hypothetical protein [Streptomyces europaeiscabiei]MDX3863673.1 hypothetical protein [Streptomyces europaeiscabiei]MDX3874138.1 hypothetical protein [Streptomyces europaeiscabiei]